MSFLSALLFICAFIFYRLFFPKPEGKLGAFVLGIISGLLVLPICVMFKITAYNSPDFWFFSASFFFFYFLFPSFLGLVLYWLFTFKSFAAESTASALFGIFSVFIFYSVFEFVNIPDASPVIILTILYCLTIFFFDIFLSVLQNFMIMSADIISVLVSYIIFLICSFFACTFFAFWFFKYSFVLYMLLPLCINFFLGLLLFIIKKKE